MASSTEPVVNDLKSPSPVRRWPCIRTMLRWTLIGCLGLWATLAVLFSNLPNWLRAPAAGAFVIALAAVFACVRPQRLATFVFLAVVGVVVIWFCLIPPSNDRDWEPELVVLPDTERVGDRVLIRNIRNCDYRSETDFDVRHYDAEFDLNRLETIDLFLSQWGSPMIAHTMVSFGFGDGRYVCISIETRRVKGRGYSALRGFFKQYELTYVVADERDVVKLRTNHRGEDVRLYRLQVPRELIRPVFLDYLESVNSLARQPEWYNALTSNCTTNIRGHMRPYAANSMFDWRILLNGRIDELTYELGRLDTTYSYPELRERSLINERAKAAGSAPDFSRRIRAGLPGVKVP